MDKQWLKNAAMFFKRDDNQSVENARRLAEGKVDYTCRDLYESAIQAKDLFNLYSGSEHCIQSFTLKRDDPLGVAGFVLMLKSFRAKVFLSKPSNQIICEYEQISGYTYKIVDKYCYTLYKDQFGAVLWGLNERFLMNNDTLLQYMLAQLFEFVKNVDTEPTK